LRGLVGEYFLEPLADAVDFRCVQRRDLEETERLEVRDLRLRQHEVLAAGRASRVPNARSIGHQGLPSLVRVRHDNVAARTATMLCRWGTNSRNTRSNTGRITGS